MGSDAIALPLLDCLRNEMRRSFSLHGIFTQPDRPHGRGMKLLPNAIKTWAVQHGIPTRQPQCIGPDDLDWLRQQNIQLVLVMAYGHLLKRELLDIPRFPILNFHASILPQFRGASPINAVIAAGHTETGVSLMQIVPALDAGPVYAIERVSLSATETPATLATKLSQACVPLVRSVLPSVTSGTLAASPQDKAAATYCRILDKSDAFLDFHASASILERRIRALTPWPGTTVDWLGAGSTTPIRLKIGHATAITTHPADGLRPGTIFSLDGAVAVATGEGTLLFHTLQRPGGKMLAASEFLRGFPLQTGTSFISEPMRPLYSVDRKSMAKL